MKQLTEDPKPKRSYKPLTPFQKAQINQKIGEKKNVNISEISKVLGINRQTISAYLKRIKDPNCSDKKTGRPKKIQTDKMDKIKKVPLITAPQQPFVTTQHTFVSSIPTSTQSYGPPPNMSQQAIVSPNMPQQQQFFYAPGLQQSSFIPSSIPPQSAFIPQNISQQTQNQGQWGKGYQTHEGHSGINIF